MLSLPSTLSCRPIMTKETDKEAGGSFRVSLVCVGFELDVAVAGYARMRKTGGRHSSDRHLEAIENMSDEVVEDIILAPDDDVEPI